LITRPNGTNSIIGGNKNASPYSLVDIHHQCKELDRPICGVEDERIHRNMLVNFKGMIIVDVGALSLEEMIYIQEVKHLTKKPRKV
jgi:hypothetical protein